MIACAALAACLGCGTTRWSDTSRTATEQLLVTDAQERAISQIDFHALANKDVYLDGRYVAGSTDEKYLIATLRQHMMASGCVIQDYPEDAQYIVELRAGSVGTNRHDLLFGVPSTHLPSGGPFPVSSPAIPELPLVKRTAQQGVCKIGVYAYDRVSGQPVWQSGTRRVVSNIKDVWVFGTGPFQSGTVVEGTQFAGDGMAMPQSGPKKTGPAPGKAVVSQEIRFPQVEDDPLQPPRRKSRPRKTQLAGGPDANATSVASTSTTAPGMPSISGSSDGASLAPIPSGPASPAPAGSPGVVLLPATADAPNAAAGTIGLLHAVDWFQNVKERGLTKAPETLTTTLP